MGTQPQLSFMTDASEGEPEKDAPAIMPAGMMGDCVAVIFAEPGKTDRLIEPHCERVRSVRRAPVDAQTFVRKASPFAIEPDCPAN